MLPAFIHGKKGKSGNSWIVAAIIAALFLLPQSPLFLGTIFSGETAVTWQGLEWAYSGYKAPTFTDLEASQSFSCGGNAQNQGSSCSSKLRSDFNTADYDEIRINYEASTSAYAGTSASGSGSFSVAFGGVGLASVASGAEERGGTNIPSDADTGSGTIVLKKTSAGWDVVKDEITIKRIAVISPVLEFFNSAGGSYGGGSTSSTMRIKVKSIAAESCKTTGGNYSFATTSCACPSGSLGFDTTKGCIADVSCKVGEVKQADGSCKVSCKADEVELQDGSCKKLIRTCIDNNENGQCDPSEPIIYSDPDSNAPVCSDRDDNKICDNVQSLFCSDSNSNGLCDSDELKWFASYCEDKNANGICDNLESGTVFCPINYSPICTKDNITFPNACLASGFGYTATDITNGTCPTKPIIIRLDCATGAVPIPTGYTCDFENGWLIRTDKIYVNTTIDCRTLPTTQDYTCTDLGNNKWVFTRTEFVNIDCYSKGCPEGSLCQAGICVTSSKRCPEDINCEQTYGAGTTCGESTGLCVKTQYLTQDCSILGCPSGNTCQKQTDNTNVCVQTSTPSIIQKAQQGGIFGSPIKISPTAIIALLVGVAGLVLLAKMRKP